MTHSAFLLGVLNFCNFVPVLVLAPWAGSAADRLDRRRVLLVTQLASAVLSGILAVLAWDGRATVAVVIVFALGLGVASAYSSPASQALVADLVEREELGSAVALSSMTFNLARAVGPALAAAAIVAFGIPTAFAINSGSYLLLIVGVLLVHPLSRPTGRRGETRLRDSLRLVRDQPRLLAFLLIVAAVGFASDPINTEGPAFAHAFHRHDTWAGLIIAAFGIGAVGAALLVAGRATGSRQRMLTTLAVMGAGVVGFSLVPSIWAAFAFLAVAGFGYLASNTSATSRLLLDVGEEHRGRMMALWSVAFLGLRPVASLLDGAVAGTLGVRVAGVVLAAPVLAGAAAIHFLHRHHRTLTPAL